MTCHFVTPDGAPRWFEGVSRRAMRLQEALACALPGDEIRVLPGVYDEPAVRTGLRAADRPLRIIGEPGATLDGRRVALRPPGLARREDFAFLKLIDCEGVVLDNLTIQNVWPTAIYLEDCRNITIHRMNLNGATYGIFARGQQTERLLIERCSWIQDERIWDGVLWKDIHAPPLPRREFDGDFFRSTDIRGHVVIRHNFIAQAFNGIHFFAPKGAAPERFNRDVWIYRNTFTFIRDNAIEAENAATNWWVFANVIYNCHSWFAFEHCRGGYVYIFANRGWFDRKPGPPGDCNTGGGVLKARTIACDDEDRLLPADPVYVFHNSWYLRASYVKKGKLRNLLHAGNAVAYARPEHHPPGVVDPGRRLFGIAGPRDPVCDGPGPPLEGFTTEWARLNIRFRDDVVLHPDYPQGVQAMGFPVGGLGMDPGFADARNGDFRLVPGSPCIGAGKGIDLRLPDGRDWQVPAGLDLGAIDPQASSGGDPWTPERLGCPSGALPEEPPTA